MTAFFLFSFFFFSLLDILQMSAISPLSSHIGFYFPLPCIANSRQEIQKNQKQNAKFVMRTVIYFRVYPVAAGTDARLANRYARKPPKTGAAGLSVTH